ncbi:MAG: O-antigen ligase family protein [Pseudomonadota bacterium]|nr:O-antigen ligase family protein [Pseudomonadota bacterium]
MSSLNIRLFRFFLVPALFFCAVLFADFIPSLFGAYADQRLLLSLSLIVLIAFGLLRLHCRRMLLSALFELWPFLPLVFSFFLSPLQYPSGDFHLVEPVYYAFYFLAFGMTGYIIRIERSTRKAAQALVMAAGIGCFFYAAMTITVYLFAITDAFSRLDHIIPWGFVNIRYWSHVATWAVPLFPLCLLVLPWKDNRLWRLGVAFTAAIWWWILFLSSSRGSMIGLFVGLILVWLCFGRSALPWVKLFVRFAVYGLIAWFLLSVVIPSLVFDEIQVRGLKSDSSGRMPLWLEAWKMSLQNFPWGMGPQSWLTHDILTDAYRASPKFGHPHNMYLMWAAEYGWISVAGLVVLCVAALKDVWPRISAARSEQGVNALYLAALTGSVTAAVVHGGVSAVFIAPGSMLIGLCVLSVFWAFIKPEPTGPKAVGIAGKATRFRPGGYLVVLIFILASAFWFRDVLRYRQAMADDLTYYQDELSLGHLPRFWFHGNFPRHPSQMPDN